jgi:Cu-Zn family superoxide dismutase
MMTNLRLPFAAAVSVAALISACQKPQEPAAENATESPAVVEPAAAPQTIALNGPDGRPVGTVTLSEDANGVTIKVDASAIPAGTHGVHLHEKGTCEGPKFESAGAHWNPMTKQHGRDNPMGAHLGDLANFEIGEGGTATTSFLVGGVTIGGTGNALADADGTSLVVHAKADDYKTDPSGNSGDRIACAVLAPPKG